MRVQANWDAYVAEEVQELPYGHLVPYPIAVEPDGFVTTLPGFRNFPDTKGAVLGAVMKVRAPHRPCCVRMKVVTALGMGILLDAEPCRASQVPKFLRKALGNYVTT